VNLHGYACLSDLSPSSCPVGVGEDFALYTNPESCFHDSYARVVSTCTGSPWQNNLFEGEGQLKGHQYIGIRQDLNSQCQRLLALASA